MELPCWIKEKIKNHNDPGTEPFLFHATLEEFQGRIIASHWEGVRWFATDPVIAQSYCAASGGSWLWAKPSYNKNDHYVPLPGDLGNQLLIQMGHDPALMDLKVKNWRIESYVLLQNHPTWNDVHRFLVEDLGYPEKEETFWVKVHKNQIMPAGWKQRGFLYIVEKPERLSLYNMSDNLEGGLTGRQWMQTDIFKKIMNNHEFDGIKISDINTSPKLGQFEHISIGLFDRIIERLRWHKIGCTSFDPYDAWYGDSETTPEYSEFLVNCKDLLIHNF